MKKILSIYPSKKLKPLLGKTILETAPKADFEEIQPLYAWYGDVYYLARKKYLIFCNAKTRIIFMMGPYQVKNLNDFRRLFQVSLDNCLSKIIPDANEYFEKVEDMVFLEKPDPGATAFLNRVKDDLDYTKSYWKARGRIMELPKDFETMFERNVTSIKGKYFFPTEKFQEEWKDLKEKYYRE